MKVPQATHVLWKALAREAGQSLSGFLESVALALAKSNSDNVEEEAKD